MQVKNFIRRMWTEQRKMLLCCHHHIIPERKASQTALSIYALDSHTHRDMCRTQKTQGKDQDQPLCPLRFKAEHARYAG